jgi:5-formyltetrahydrofolate cyclo-ligase
MKLTQLRARLRTQRADLEPEAIRAASESIARTLWSQPVMSRAQRIGCYLAVNSEVDCEPAMVEAWARGRQIFLPVLHSGSLRFAPYAPGTRLVLNRFGIGEPAVPFRNLVPALRLDVVLAPLLAFDMHGTRLGMGGGYYDRSLAALSHRSHWRRPRMIGLAYDFQHVPALPRRRWDIPLHAAITENGAYTFAGGSEKTLRNRTATPSGHGKN